MDPAAAPALFLELLPHDVRNILKRYTLEANLQDADFYSLHKFAQPAQVSVNTMATAGGAPARRNVFSVRYYNTLHGLHLDSDEDDSTRNFVACMYTELANDKRIFASRVYKQLCELLRVHT